MSERRKSLTKFVVTAVLAVVGAELMGRAVATWFGVEPFYDDHHGWLRMIIVAPVVTWAFFRFGVIERLRERGHIR